MVWPCFKVFWSSKDNPTGHSERIKKKRQTEEDVGRQYQRVDRNGMLFVCLFVLLFVVVVSGEPKQKQGRGLVDHKLVQAPQ